jgi:YfiH family protein
MMFDMRLPEPSVGFEWVQAEGGPALVCSALQPIGDHLFTTRLWRLGSRSSEPADAAWADVARTLRVNPASLARVHQVHGSAVVVARSGNDADAEVGDIIVTDAPDMAVAVQAADCVPLLIGDRRTGAVAAAHAGWRGLAGNVPRVAIDALAREFGSRATDLTVAAGPSVGPCCYEVGADVRGCFETAGFSAAALERWFLDRPKPTPANPSMPNLSAERRPEHWFFDGWTAVSDELQEAGVPAVQIHLPSLCTASHPTVLCSYRREGKQAGRIAAAIRCAPRRP